MYGRKYAFQQRESAAIPAEALHGFVESNIYHKNEAFLERYMNRQREFNNHFSDTLIAQGIPSRLIEVFALLGLFILVALSQWSGNTGNGTIITIGAFMAAAYKIIPGIVKILNLSGQINTYAYTVDDLLLQKQYRCNLLPVQPACHNAHSNRCNSTKCISNMVQIAILRDITGRLSPAILQACAGHSGTGKTTVLNLLLGFLDPAPMVRYLSTDR
jgi:ABC-type transport system involved in cytochrome bd biosynthesis fused ATPase/permease subunit